MAAGIARAWLDRGPEPSSRLSLFLGPARAHPSPRSGTRRPQTRGHRGRGSVAGARGLGCCPGSPDGIADPVGLGFIDSLAHRGKNATGIAGHVPEGFAGKAIQLLKELVPQASQIALLTNSANPGHQRGKAELPDIERALGVKLLIVEANGIDQAATAFDAASKQGAQAIEIWGDPYILVRSPEIVALAAQYRLPAGYYFRQNVLDGGLISLGPDWVDPWRRAADYVDRILKGARPADLPVWQPTQYHLAVNLKTAAALSITVPPLILAEADEVIE